MLKVRKSKIEGVGLFTDAPIKARMKVGEYTGERISVREARRRAKTREHIAIVELSDKEAIDESVPGGGPFQYINHSCSPNVFIRIAYNRVEFYAKRDIAAGEEMTVDYEVSHHDGGLRCQCGASGCRDFI
ncbi:MAG TPA: SET domain-containing protein-lysine N-methyltransferase [Terriglobales bacterium]|nr:SET domain-containing protein-lysine N-methyltransferase [Terriglobales bacterium]